MIDGASDFKIFYRIMMPVCKPVLATIALFIAVDQWNQWIDNYIFASGNKSIATLQFQLMKLVQTKAAVDVSQAMENVNMAQKISPLGIRASMTIVATVPILLVYPFLQKYFVLGLNVGSIKE